MPTLMVRRKTVFLLTCALGFFLVFALLQTSWITRCSCLTAIPSRDTLIRTDDRKLSTESKTSPGLDVNHSQKRHVVYVRIPKTGSSSVSVMIWNFAWRHNLSVLTSHPHWTGTRGAIEPPWFYIPPQNVKMDMMAEHVFFSLQAYTKYFHDDTAYVTMLREPMSMLVSSLYYIPEFNTGVPGKNKVQSYLRNPKEYDNIAIRAGRSYTRNPQSGYFGLKEQDYNKSNSVNTLISFMGADIMLVMILERLDESLVLLKRTLGWSMLDVIPSDYNRNENRQKPNVNITVEQREQYRQWSLADHRLYEFFYKKLDETVQKLGTDFQNEVQVFRKFRKNMSRFCRFEAITSESLEVPGSDYNAPFRVTVDDCLLHRTEALVLIGMIRKRQGYFPYLHKSLEKAGYGVTEGFDKQKHPDQKP